jgi:TolB-like protein
VAVLGFQNLSSRADPAWLSTAFSEMLGTELASSEQLCLVSSEDVALLRNDVAIPNTGSLSKSTLAQIHKAIGADLVVLGSYSDLGKKSGGKFRLDLRLQDTMAGETIATISETGTESDLFQLVSMAGADLRKRLGIRGLLEGDTAAVRASLSVNSHAAHPDYDRKTAEVAKTAFESSETLGRRDRLFRTTIQSGRYKKLFPSH